MATGHPTSIAGTLMVHVARHPIGRLRPADSVIVRDILASDSLRALQFDAAACGDDPTREAGVPDGVEFAIKPELAMVMLTRALDAGVPAGWVTGEEVYGQHYRLRASLEQRRMPYVLAVPVNQHVIATTDNKIVECRADTLIATLPAQAWKKISACNGAKGPRLYYWARAAVRPLEDSGMGYWLLARRSLSDPTDLAYYLCLRPGQHATA